MYRRKTDYLDEERTVLNKDAIFEEFAISHREHGDRLTRLECAVDVLKTNVEKSSELQQKIADTLSKIKDEISTAKGSVKMAGMGITALITLISMLYAVNWLTIPTAANIQSSTAVSSK